MRKLFTFILTALLLVSTGVLADDYSTLVVGCAANASASFDAMKVYVDKGDSWGTEENSLNGTSMTFEGKKLFVGSYNTHADKHIYVMKFKKFLSSSWVSDIDVYSGSKVYNYYTNYIYNCDAGTWYGQKTIKSDARFYFDATGWNETEIKLCVGHANYQGYYDISNIEHTKLYYGSTSANWDDAMGIGVVGNTSATSGTHWIDDVANNASEYTGFINEELKNAASGNAYLMVNAGKAGEKPSMSYNDDFRTLLNNTQTIKYSVETAGVFAELTEGTVPANITMSSYKFVEGTYDGVSASNASAALTQGGSNYSATIGAARTANTTLTVSNIAAGYFFIGWYSEANGGICLEKGDTYTYNPVEDGTVYARFEYGDYPLEISSALWSSLYLPQAVVVPANCKAYYVSDVTGTTATLVAINAGQVIPAQTPVIVEATSSNTYYFNYSASNAVAPTPNLLHGVTATTPIASVEPGASNTLYVLGVKESVVGFYVPSAQITTLAPYKAYLIAGTITGAPMIRFEENDATGIQNVKVSEKAVKFIENGKLFIQKDGVVYDMTGRVVR